MKFRMDKVLRFWVDCSCSEIRHESTTLTKDQLIAEILRRYERCGDAMRYLDANGRVSWKASPRMLQHLADLERDAEEDSKDLP